MRRPRFLDTNILLYAVSREPADAAKRDRAVALLEDHDDWVLSVQVLQEFYVQAIRPHRLGSLTPAVAEAFVQSWLRFPVQPVTVEILQTAIRVQQTRKLSYWDSAIIAAALALGCDELLTEDLQHGQIIEGLHIVNPFL